MKYLIPLFLLVIVSCKPGAPENAVEVTGNPAADGFNMEGSDVRAMEIADSVMMAMGGRKAWDDTRVIAWNFMGRRDLVWNKANGDVRIDSPGDSTVYLYNVVTHTGRAFKDGQEITDAEQLKAQLNRAHSIWINDSYWLCMPFKLKDSGVTLSYLREDTTRMGIEADVLQMTFEDVGVTPQNKYQIWVDKEDRLVKQWAYFREASQDSASGIWPFDNYSRHGAVLFSSDRSDDRGPKNVRVFDELDPSVFNDPAAPVLPPEK